MRNIISYKKGGPSQKTAEMLEQAAKLETEKTLQQRSSLPRGNQLKAIWQEQVGKARIWGFPTEEKLLQSEGQIERLAGLVQERYAISRAEAERHAEAFLRRRHS